MPTFGPVATFFTTMVSFFLRVVSFLNFAAVSAGKASGFVGAKGVVGVGIVVCAFVIATQHMLNAATAKNSLKPLRSLVFIVDVS
jgi:hypothetical protein